MEQKTHRVGATPDSFFGFAINASRLVEILMIGLDWMIGLDYLRHLFCVQIYMKLCFLGPFDLRRGDMTLYICEFQRGNHEDRFVHNGWKYVLAFGWVVGYFVG